jgi:tetratricopeptide (TPR) repeat protein
MANGSPNQPDQSNGRRDLFLSYNSRDRENVLRVRQLLDKRNISTFFDRDQLSAGSRWVSLLENEVGGSRAVSVFIGPHGLGDWQEMEMQLALVRQIDEKKAGRPFPVIPLILPGATPEKELGFLKLYTWVDLRARLDDPAAIDELERAVRGNAPAQLTEAAVELCPYRALQAFREQDEKLFFGRERFAEQLLEKARDEKLNLIAVVGPSGSGKSSVVQAGLLPRLRRERPPRVSWEAVIFTPGKAPFHNLAAALVTVGAAEQDRWERLGKAEKLGQDLAGGAIRLEAAIATALAEAPGADRLLLIVDQAEELFTLTTEQDRKPFIHRLLAAADAVPLTIALTLRTDFYGQAIGYSRELGELITEGQVNILPMSRDELRQAIVAPADSVELQFEDGLVERILDHVEDEPGNLPLLEFALTELWSRRQGNLLSNEAYKEIGGVEGAISRRAEAQFNRLSREQQETAHRVLTRLVRVADATEEGTDTRQRVRLSELHASAREVAQTFANARLLVTNRIEIKNEKTGADESEEIIEVAHEALIRSWQRLKELLNRDRQFLLWRQRLGIALSEWRRTGRDTGALLRGVPLNEARRWRKERAQGLNDREQEFIAHSESAEKRPKYWIAAAIAFVAVIALVVIGWNLWDNRPQSQINKILAQSPGAVKIAATDAFEVAGLSVGWLNALVLTGRSNEALDAARNIEAANLRSQALVGVVEILANTGKTVEALDAAHKIEDADTRSQALARVAWTLANVGKTEEAKLAAAETLDVAGKTEAAFSRSRVLASVALALAIVGKTAEALAAAHKIEDANRRSPAVIFVVETLAIVGKTDEALAAAHKIKDADTRSQALARVAGALANAGETVEALAATHKIKIANTRYKALASVAKAFAKAGKTVEALDVARKIKDVFSRSQTLARVAEALANAGKIDEAKSAAAEALDVARKIKIEDALSRSEALASVAGALANVGKPVEAESAAAEALDVARKSWSAFYSSWVLASAALSLANAGKTVEALDAAHKIKEPDTRSQALASVVGALANAGKTVEALDAARNIEDADTRSKALVKIVEVLVRRGETANKASNVIVEAQQAAEQITKEEDKSKALANVATGLAKLHLYRQARELVDLNRTSARDKLTAYTAILR